jgi:hypothetical protein
MAMIHDSSRKFACLQIGESQPALRPALESMLDCFALPVGTLGSGPFKWVPILIWFMACCDSDGLSSATSQLLLVTRAFDH